jgi:hypothetical protein
VLPGQKESAERLRIELTLGQCSIPEVVAWADEVVARDPSPDPELLELATCSLRTQQEVCVLLGSVSGEPASIRAAGLVLGSLRDVLAVDPASGERIARQVYEMAQWGFLPHETFGWEPWSLEDHFYLAACGYCGDQASAVRALDEFLARHEARSAS